MKTINNFISEKLHINNNVTYLDYEDCYGIGEEMQFKDCTFPFGDILDEENINSLRKIIKEKSNINGEDYVYFIKDSGNSLSRCQNISDNLKTQIRKLSSQKISNWEPDCSIRIYEIADINNKPTKLIECQNWRTMTTQVYWYIKINKK